MDAIRRVGKHATSCYGARRALLHQHAIRAADTVARRGQEDAGSKVMQHQELLQAEERRIVRMRSTEVSYPTDAHKLRCCCTTRPEATAQGLEHDGVSQHDDECGVHRRRGLRRHDVRHVRQLQPEVSRSVVWQSISYELRGCRREFVG
eukprot:7391184-Prymnesium_polylepis.1